MGQHTEIHTLHRYVVRVQGFQRALHLGDTPAHSPCVENDVIALISSLTSGNPGLDIHRRFIKVDTDLSDLRKNGKTMLTGRRPHGRSE